MRPPRGGVRLDLRDSQQPEDFMYGTVARIKVKPGKEQALMEDMKVYDNIKIDGHVATAIYKADAGDGEYWMAVIFENQEKYRANADAPEQNDRYEKMMESLEAAPEWHDGEVIVRNVS
jgi:antibiotic biosynthesis monooxygenase (ABM) superfamily enzyme